MSNLRVRLERGGSRIGIGQTHGSKPLRRAPPPFRGNAEAVSSAPRSLVHLKVITQLLRQFISMYLANCLAATNFCKCNAATIPFLNPFLLQINATHTHIFVDIFPFSSPSRYFSKPLFFSSRRKWNL